MDGFKISENKGRTKFGRVCKHFIDKKKMQDYHFTRNPYCPVDCIVKIKERIIAVEIKNLSKKLKENYFIKVEKYNGIKQFCQKYNIRKAVYIVFYEDTMYALDLLSIPEISKEEIIYLQKTNVYGGEKIPTPVYRFPTKLMKKCKLQLIS